MVARGARYEAKQAGAKHYRRDIPCKAGGHMFYVNGGHCVCCDKARVKRNHETRPNYRVVRATRNKRYRSVHTEDLAAYLRTWQIANPGKVNYYSGKRRAALLQRTPAWADLGVIQAFYAACPVGYQVDHVVPLQGRNVSGLHVLNNLQYLTLKENRSKGNRHAT